MKVLCSGSMNIDHVYSIEHIISPKDTIFSGGKGQSVAAAKASFIAVLQKNAVPSIHSPLNRVMNHVA